MAFKSILRYTTGMKVLLVEDDNSLAQTIKTSLASESHVVEVAENGADGSFLARSFDYDAIVLDNALPKKDGLTVCREVRSSGKTTPIIFLTVDDSLETKLSAFDNGADDYIQKPFSLRELSVRLKAVGRRPSTIQTHILKVHDLTLDTEKHTISRASKRIHVTRKEFSLLEFLLRNVGVVLSRALLMEHVWTADSNPFSNTVEAHIRNLRMKLNAGNKENLIANIPGRGYVIDTPENIRESRPRRGF